MVTDTVNKGRTAPATSGADTDIQNNMTVTITCVGGRYYHIQAVTEGAEILASLSSVVNCNCPFLRPPPLHPGVRVG